MDRYTFKNENELIFFIDPVYSSKSLRGRGWYYIIENDIFLSYMCGLIARMENGKRKWVAFENYSGIYILEIFKKQFYLLFLGNGNLFLKNLITRTLNYASFMLNF